MKTKENVFSVDKQPEKRVSREAKSLSKESVEGDQSSITDENTFRNKGFRPDNERSRNNLSGNITQTRKNASYSFVVDWQIPESFE